VVVVRKRHHSGGASFTGKLKREETKCGKSQEKKTTSSCIDLVGDHGAHW